MNVLNVSSILAHFMIFLETNS